ncbi:MAG: hypothetical protein IJ587_13310, partial [Synergistaceae bacterium]|nr:hypothetical protein [Synergistaceae bacterium]
KNYSRKKNDVASAEKASANSELRLRKAKANSLRAVSEGKSARSKLNEANENYRKIFDSMMSMRAKTSSAVLEHERSKLIEGTPCPLCGATHHPMIKHSVSGAETPSPERLFRETERLEAELQRAKSAVDAAEKYFNDVAVTNWNKASSIESAAEETFRNCKENLSSLRKELEVLEANVIEAVRPLRISDVSDSERVLKISRGWAETVSSLEKRIKELESRKSIIEAGLAALKANSESLRSELEALTSELSNLESSFSEKLRQMKFPDEETFRASRKSPDEIEIIKRKKSELDSMTDRLQGALSNLQKQLEEKNSMNLTEKSHEEIESLYRDEESILRRLHENIGILSQKLKELHQSSEKIKELEKEYSLMKDSAENWTMLDKLIGSLNGDKFRVYAQKVTLALVVDNANKYLKRMNGRYTLILTPDSNDLELSVRDSEQAGEVRPTANLSGGEKFIVSLALALGLSQISGSKAQVDSLFIDEGFGSLDDEALNSALEALGEIKRDGRMIGIISHVSGISERIPVQIHVIRKSEGKSIIEGPGCSGSN